MPVILPHETVVQGQLNNHEQQVHKLHDKHLPQKKPQLNQPLNKLIHLFQYQRQKCLLFVSV